LTFPDVLFTDKKLLLEALAVCGFDQVEEGTNLPLFGYHGDQRPETAELVIRRKNTGVMQSNDIGFAYDHTRKGYVPIVSEYDSRAVSGGLFLRNVRTQYSYRVIETVKKRLHGTSQTTSDKGVVRIKVRF
jgi:hypothetical protein